MKRLYLAAFLLLVASPIAGMGQTSKGSIAGRVTDPSHAVVQNARIVITPGNLTARSNELGEFVVPGLAQGSYTINVTSVGFEALSKTVEVTAGQGASVELVLTVSLNHEEIVVSAGTGKDLVQAVNEELDAPNIVQVMPESQIVSLPNANVADAVGRMPGVTLQRDEGEGVYVQVRGLDPRLTNVTINGVTIPSPEAAIRQVNLATIPSDMVQAIELNKTLSANQDADGIGGSVNLVTKTASNEPTISIAATIGQTPIENTRYVGDLDLTLGKRFGASKRWGVIASAGYDYNGRGINDIEPSPDVNPDGTATPYYDGTTLREYRYQRLRWGGTLGADYKLSERSSLAAHLLLSDFKDWGDKWYYEINTNDKPKYYESSRKPDFAIGSFDLSGNHIFNNAWIHWGSAVSRSRELNAGGNPEVKWSTAKALKNYDTANCNYVGTSAKSVYLPQWSAGCMQPNSNPADDTFNLQNYTIDEFITTTGQAVQLNLQEWGSVGMNYHAGSHSATLEFGGEFRNGHKFQNAWTPSYDYNGSATADQFQSGFSDPHYYGGNYYIGPFTDYYQQVAYFNANQSLFSLDVNDTHFGSDPNNFDLIERVSAGYIMNTINWDHFRLQTGLRIEGTQTHGVGIVPNQDSNGNWISDTNVTSSASYWDPLPSVQARWALTQDTNLRAVYARGISRPNPFDLVPYVIINDGSNPAIQIGNPSIKPTHANNFDLLIEHSIRSIGLLEGGFFYKQLSNPIFADYSIIPSTSPYYGISGTSVDIQEQNINGTNAHVTGLEIAWQQKFAALPAGFSGLGISANYAFTASDTEGIPGRTDTPALVGQAKNSLNFEPSYEYRRYEAHLGVSYNGANIYAYQYVNSLPAGSGEDSPGPINGPWGDNYFYPHLQVDAQAGIRLFRGLHLEVKGLNLTNEVFGFYNGSPQYMTQREYYKPTYSASLRWTSHQE